MFCTAIFALLSVANLVLSTPAPRVPFGLSSKNKFVGCPVSNAKLSLPNGQSSLVVPAGSPVYIAVGVGHQNYTCDSTGKFVSTGAIAKMFDASCLVNTPGFDQIQDKLFDAVGDARGQDLIRKVESVLHRCATVLGDHYSVRDPSGGPDVLPAFDFRSGIKQGDESAFIVGKKVGGLASPSGPSNIDWVSLQNIGGKDGGMLAGNVMRVQTKAGQPPNSCKPGENASPRYATQYWLFK